MISKQPNFYSVIIGTELLNGRRRDAHFDFLNKELLARGWKQKASFVIVDDPQFMLDVFNLIKQDKNGVMFCYGGIGSTPDDYTRQVAAEAFSNGVLQCHEEAKKRILKEFEEAAYPHRITMANIPKGAKLLDNIVNNVPGFYLEDRFFFTPGFPSMSQPMILQALNEHYSENSIKSHRMTLTAMCGESDLIDTMKALPCSVELSSLPHLNNGKRSVVISLESYDLSELSQSFEMFKKELKKNKIFYKIDK